MGATSAPSSSRTRSWKIFLTASARTRARRRLLQRGDSLEVRVGLERETAMLAARDEADSHRAVAPLTMAPDAIALDTTGLSFEEQVARIVGLVRGRR